MKQVNADDKIFELELGATVTVNVYVTPPPPTLTVMTTPLWVTTFVTVIGTEVVMVVDVTDVTDVV